MRIQVVAVGRLKAGPERELAERYRARSAALARGLGFGGPDILELPEGRGRRSEDRQVEEAARIRERAGASALVLFDEAAAAPTSEAFAACLVEARDSGRPALAFVVGGPDGLHPALKAEAASLHAFGRMTLPHQLVRVLVLEQLYRSFTIIAGHPYHRGGGGDA